MALHVTGWTFLVTGVGAMFGRPVLAWVCVAAMALATLCLAARDLCALWAQRVRARVLLEWASHRPGQLGRGLPGVSQGASLGRATHLLAFCLIVILVGSTAALVIAGALVVLLQLLFWVLEGLDPRDLGFGAGMVGAGAVLAAVTLALGRAWGWLVARDARVWRATRWVGHD